MQNQQALQLKTGTSVIVKLQSNGRSLSQQRFGVVQRVWASPTGKTVLVSVALNGLGYTVQVPANKVKVG